MEVLSVDCNHCGAPLEVGAKTRFVTCRYCQQRLEVKRSENAVFTEVLGELQERTEQIASDVDIIKWQNELERLDREWQTEREGFMETNKNGHRYVPTRGGAVFGFVIMVVACLVMIGMLGSTLGGHPFMLLPFAFMVFVGIKMFRSFHRAGGFEEAEKRHHVRRQQILTQLRRVQKG